MQRVSLAKAASWVLLIVCLLAPLLTGRVFTSLERHRVKLVETPSMSRGRTTELSTERLEAFSKSGITAALILRVTNNGPNGRFAVLVDHVPVCERTISTRGSKRIDCRIEGWSSSHSKGITTISITGPNPGWSLDYLEVASHHGNTTGLVSLFVLPNGTHQLRPVHPAIAALTSIAIVLCALFVPPAPSSYRVKLVQRVLAFICCVVLGLVLVSPWCSPFELVISFGTFAFFVVIIGAFRVWTPIFWLAEPTTAARANIIFRSACLAGAVILLFLAPLYAHLHNDYDGNYSGFLQISKLAFDNNPLLAHREDVRGKLLLRPDRGYDGQYLFFTTFDPLMQAFRHDPAQYSLVVDAVPYRYGRIGFSWLTVFATGNRWEAFPQAMVWLVLGGLGAASLCISLLASGRCLSPALGLLVLLVPGFWQSVQLALPEPIAAAFLVAGILALQNSRLAVAASLFAVALLIRETGVLAVVVVGIGMALNGKRREAAWVLTMAIVPTVAWRLYIGSTMFPDWGVMGFLAYPADLGWPFTGLAEMVNVVNAGSYYGGSKEFARAGFMFPALLTTGCALALALVVKRPGVFSIAALGYALIAVSLNYKMIWIHVGNGQRGTYEMFMMLALCCLDFSAYSKVLKSLLLGFWCFSFYYTFWGAFDAAFIRTAIGLPF